MQDNCAQSIASFKSFMDKKSGGTGVITKDVVTPKSMMVKKEKSVVLPLKVE